MLSYSFSVVCYSVVVYWMCRVLFVLLCFDFFFFLTSNIVSVDETLNGGIPKPGHTVRRSVSVIF